MHDAAIFKRETLTVEMIWKWADNSKCIQGNDNDNERCRKVWQIGQQREKKKL